MIDERAQAISFAEYYFALVDGIFPGFENHLAKNIVLDWFGNKIVGKENVTAFINSNQTRTLHIFTDITPISDITCNKKQCNRKQKTLDQIAEKKKLKTDTSKREVNRTRRLYKNAVKYLDKVKIIDYTVRESNSTNVEADDREMYKEKDPLNDLEREITSVYNEEIQQNINESKLEEEMASTVKPIKRECGQGDRTVRAQTDPIKYMEANGQVRFTRRILQEDPWSYHWTSLKVNHWVHTCKLQIAYSRCSVSEHPEVFRMLKNVPLTRRCKKPNNTMEIQSQRKLPTLEEIIKISNKLIPNVNNFGGYLKSLNYTKDRNDFLKDFEATMTQKNPNANLPTVHYVGNKLIFEHKDDMYKENFIRKFLYNNYRIHRIVYEEVEMNENCMTS
ncbi:uncharacterized protein LOC116847186 [Odontomachus brunneus]|uniref:uncharacterized protein LOC116847186 n=1 Tax=Odontomachus brunneus TaxID=486640 RepID=UPI0013F18C75|nr:uncharacterized protein LOC116847186 [Odontomachus brunneus]